MSTERLHPASSNAPLRSISWPGLPPDTRLEVKLKDDELLVTVPPRGFTAYALFCLPLAVAGVVVGSKAASQVLQGGGALSILMLLFGSFVVLFALVGFFEQALLTKRIRVTHEALRLYRSARDEAGVRIRRDEAQELLARHASRSEARVLRDLFDVVRSGSSLPA